ncbi:conserved exported hypothetical protein [Paraburkholderia tropica]|uniref:hypothetical protein n=1 Tax=Paraburkholderia tropica TaxID=92647 RepID=UPI001CB38F29|nr:hypothetical protein [Paraburkholderia tropica]CAG9231473.1 conserved exported hypothetical protein [Paraburkholderia tropica]
MKRSTLPEARRCKAALVSTIALAGALVSMQAVAQSQANSAADNANKSNNPLNLAASFNVQNMFAPSLYGSSAVTNDLLLRGTLPLGPNGLVPVPQILRLTAPISTRPDPTGGYNTGLGDLNLFDIFLVSQGATQIGIGPLVTAPTATDPALGTGKWQAGLAAVVVDASRARLLGALVQWQHSFAGQSSRPTVQSLTAQPFGIFNLPDGWYIRSTGIWTFDLQHGAYYIPVGLGGGKAWKAGGTIYNVFVEPQYSVAHSGAGVPKWQIFAGLNMTFGK